MTTNSTPLNKLIDDLIKDEFGTGQWDDNFDVAETGGSYDNEGNFLTWEEWDRRDREEFPEEFLEEDFENEFEEDFPHFP